VSERDYAAVEEPLEIRIAGEGSVLI
jgi:hypothetical protein